MIRVLSGELAYRAIENDWPRASSPDPDLSRQVRTILEEVRSKGDEGVRAVAKRVGDIVPEAFELSKDEVHRLRDRVQETARAVIEKAAENIRVFCDAVMATLRPVQVRSAEGFTVGLDFSPVRTVACYVPAGRFPLASTALMTALTARAAGVPEIWIVCPDPVPEIVFAGSLAGVGRFFRIGGAQAVAAFAFGTRTVPRADMIVGPGNTWVAEAKRQVQDMVGIDMIAGPSEVIVVADRTSDPEWIALDLLAQAEHDPNARAWLLTDDAVVADRMPQAISEAAQQLGAPAYALADGGPIKLVRLPSMDACIEACNGLGPEHLHVQTANASALKSRFDNYGAIFIGTQSSVSFGDYVAGPNHTLPTGGRARFTGALTPLDFLRTQSWIEMGEGASPMAEAAGSFADMEGLSAHGAAARARGDR